jgi:L-ascorbate metabolism protein UlaG (beta-lactamase superfamily)
MPTTSELPTVRRGGRGAFADRLTAPLPGPAQFLRLLREGGLHGTSREADLVPVLRDGFPDVAAGTTALTWVGHASYVIRIDGKCVLADPVWTQKLNGSLRRITPPGLALSQLPQVDAVVISHNHYDHLDAGTIARLPRGTPVFVPRALGGWFTRRGFTAVTELDWWESAEAAGLRFDCVPTHHWSRRGLLDSCATLWGGWVVTGSRHRVFHAGDSGYGHRFAEIGRRYPDIDVAMLPIGAYDPVWFMRAVHMAPEESVRALADLGARRLPSMHWCTFVLTREPVMEPLRRLRRAWEDAGLPR